MVDKRNVLYVMLYFINILECRLWSDSNEPQLSEQKMYVRALNSIKLLKFIIAGCYMSSFQCGVDLFISAAFHESGASAEWAKNGSH